MALYIVNKSPTSGTQNFNLRNLHIRTAKIKWLTSIYTACTKETFSTLLLNEEKFLNWLSLFDFRYILISCHSVYDKLYTPRYICLMLAFTWLFSFSMMIPPLLEIWGRLGLDPPTFSCTILKKEGKSPKKMLFVLGFILPCVVIILSYTCIYWKVRQSQRNLQSHK